jgi:antitoxin VapB
MHKAKIFKNGQSQAVRLPKDCRLEGTEVSVIKLGRGIVLQPILSTWTDILKELSNVKADEILVNREDLPPIEREELK